MARLSKKALRVALLVALSVILSAGFLIGWALISKTESDQPIGGEWHWVVEKPVLPVAEGVSGVRLYRGTGRNRSCIAMNAFDLPRYLGEDCVGYEVSNPSGRRYFVACGDREPLFAAEAKVYEKWLFSENSLEKRAELMPDGSTGNSELRMPLDELRKAALAQPPRSRRGCD